jgi:hypothetical protein
VEAASVKFLVPFSLLVMIGRLNGVLLRLSGLSLSSAMEQIGQPFVTTSVPIWSVNPLVYCRRQVAKEIAEEDASRVL